MRIALLIMFELRYIHHNINDFYKYLIDYYNADIFLLSQRKFDDDEARLNLFQRKVVYKELYSKPELSEYFNNYDYIQDKKKDGDNNFNWNKNQVLQLFINMNKMSYIIEKYINDYDYFIMLRTDSKILFPFPPSNILYNIPKGTYQIKANYCHNWGGVGFRFLISKEYILSYLRSPYEVINSNYLIDLFLNNNKFKYKNQENLLNFSLEYKKIPNYHINSLNYYYTCEDINSYTTWAKPKINAEYNVICKYPNQCIEAYKNLNLYKKKNFKWIFINNNINFTNNNINFINNNINLINNTEWFAFKKHFIKKNNILICTINTFLKKKFIPSSKNLIKQNIKQNTKIKCIKIENVNEQYFKILI